LSQVGGTAAQIIPDSPPVKILKLFAI